MHHTYVLYSGKDNGWYTGAICDWRARSWECEEGRVTSRPINPERLEPRWR